MNQANTFELEGVRLDRWLWAARFFKTRAMATDAVNGGKVQVNGARAKPSKLIKPGFEIMVRKGPYQQTVVVQGLMDKRVSAKIAATLYDETETSVQARESTRVMMQCQPSFSDDRPNKKQRREVMRFKRNR